MKTCPCTGTIHFLKIGRHKHWYVVADVWDQASWPFPSDAFVFQRKKYRNRILNEGDRVVFLAIERNGDLVAWKLKKLAHKDTNRERTHRLARSVRGSGDVSRPGH